MKPQNSLCTSSKDMKRRSAGTCCRVLRGVRPWFVQRTKEGSQKKKNQRPIHSLISVRSPRFDRQQNQQPDRRVAERTDLRDLLHGGADLPEQRLLVGLGAVPAVADGVHRDLLYVWKEGGCVVCHVKALLPEWTGRVDRCVALRTMAAGALVPPNCRFLLHVTCGHVDRANANVYNHIRISRAWLVGNERTRGSGRTYVHGDVLVWLRKHVADGVVGFRWGRVGGWWGDDWVSSQNSCRGRSIQHAYNSSACRTPIHSIEGHRTRTGTHPRRSRPGCRPGPAPHSRGC